MGRNKTGKKIHCENCGKLRYFTLGYLEKNKHFYCSHKCIKNTPWNKGKTKDNDERLKSISKKSSEQMHREYANGIRDKNKIVKKAHEAVRKKGLEKFNKKPRMYISKRGYWMIYIPIRKDVKYHHYIWEKQFGEVPTGYHLHHINLDKLDNRIENLQLLPASAHIKLHNKLRRRNKLGQYNKD